MTVSDPRPPRWAEWLLRRWLPGDVGRWLEADLDDAYRRRAARWGRRRADVWYVGQVVRSLRPAVRRAAPRAAGPARTGPDRSVAALGADVLRGWRTLRRNPIYAGVAVAVLGLAIGTALAVADIVRGTLYGPLPYPDADRLVMLWEVPPDVDALERASPANFMDWRERARSFSSMAVWREHPAILREGGEGRPIVVARVTRDFFPLTGVGAALGRTLTPDDHDGAWYDAAERYRGTRELVGVLSHAFWVQRFGAAAEVLGEVLDTELGGVRIVGVLPPDFDLPSRAVDLWVPMAYPVDPERERNARYVPVVARLSPHVDRGAAADEMELIADELARLHPETNQGWSVRLQPFREARVGDLERPLRILSAAVAVLLLVACANVAGLQVARGATRSDELALRRALGATRGRVLRELSIENALLAGLGGALGLASLPFLRGGLMAWFPGSVAQSHGVGWLAVAVPLLLVVVTGVGVLAAVAPALTRPGDALGVGGRIAPRGTRLRRWIVAAEVGAAVVLVAVAGLLGRSLSALQRVDPGFRAHDVAVMRVFLDKGRYGSGTAEGRSPTEYYARATERLAALPFVRAAGAVTALPMLPTNTVDFARPWTRPGAGPPGADAPVADIRMVTPGYFETVGIELLEGRPFTTSDGPDAEEVVIVNEVLARRLHPDVDPIGRTVVVDYRGVRELRIVGVVESIRFHALRGPPRPEIYLPHAQVPYLALSVVARVDGDPASRIPELRSALARVDPLQPISSAFVMEELVRQSAARERFAAFTVGVLSLAALVLAATGLYGVMAYLVALRRRELGVRVALGAPRRRVVTLVVGQALGVAAAGGAAGMAVALLGARVLSGFLYGVPAWDPITFGGTGVVVTAVTALAALGPAFRAASVDPVRALGGHHT